jgi:hypothetical protein
MYRQVTENLRKSGWLGPLLSWYYRSWIASPDLGGPASSGIPWGYMMSYTCLGLYTLVLTVRYSTLCTFIMASRHQGRMARQEQAPLYWLQAGHDAPRIYTIVWRSEYNHKLSIQITVARMCECSTTLLSLGYTSRDALAVLFG